MGEAKEKEVDYRFKLMYAFGMIFIVSGHCVNGGLNLMYDWFPVRAFHLGLFVFVSGYFYKKGSENQLGKYILKKVKTLLVPLYLWNLFYALLVMVLANFGFTIGGEVTLEKLTILPITSGHQFEYNLSSWFVAPLFMLQVLNATVRKIVGFIKKDISEWMYFIFSMFLGIMGVYLSIQGYNKEWWLVLVRMLYFVPFYSLGILYKNVLEKYDKIPNIIYFSSIFIAQMIIIIVYGKVPTCTPAWCTNFNNGPVAPFIAGFLAIAFWLRVCKILENVIGRNKYVNLIADNTYSIMVNHLTGFMLVKVGFAIVKKYTDYCSYVDIERIKTQIFYTPCEIPQFRILYLVGGITFSIVVQLVLNKIIKFTKDKISTT